MIIIKSIINDFEDVFRNGTEIINKSIKTVIEDLQDRHEILHQQLIQWKDDKIKEIETIMDNISKNNDKLQKLLNRTYNIKTSVFLLEKSIRSIS